MTSTDRHGEAPAKKRTRVMTNIKEITQRLAKPQCGGSHRHVVLDGVKASACQIYPDEFCEAICAAYSRSRGVNAGGEGKDCLRRVTRLRET